MNKYRIVKEETTNGLGEVTDAFYIIQKRFLFWWFDCNIPCPSTFSTSNTCYINTRVEKFSSKENAQSYIHDYLLKGYEEYYKNHKIIKLLDDDNRPIFIDKSDIVEMEIDKYCNSYDYYFDYDYSLEGIKGKIDSKITKVKKTIV